MLVLTGQGSTDRLHKESHQIMDVVGMFKPVTKWATTILNPETIPRSCARPCAWRAPRNPAPCTSSCPKIRGGHGRPTQQTHVSRGAYRRSVPDDKIVDRIRADARSAKRPVIIAGNGCIRRRASKQLQAALRARPALASSARSWRRAPSTWMRIIACTRSDSAARTACQSKAIDDADLVITLGFDMVEYHPQSLERQSRQAHHACRFPAGRDRRATTIPEVGARRRSRAYAVDAERTRSTRPTVPDFDFENQRRDARADHARTLPSTSDDDTRGHDSAAERRCGMPARSWGRDDVLLSDVGAHKMWIARHYQCHEPNTCLIPNGFCSMGFALPGAIAATIVFPERRILAICR